MKLAVVFPGQGSQYVGMGRTLAESSSQAAKVFAEADDALGEPLTSLAFDGPEEELNQTVNAQPAILATSVAYVWAAEERAGSLPLAAFYAGHSMGQYSAMVAAGVISLADGVRLVRERGRLMQAAPDGAMAAIIGLPDERISDLVAAGQSAGVFTVANRNSPGQIVVSGDRSSVDVAVEKARGLGAKRAVVLPITVAAHSPLMAGAAEGMREILADFAFADPRVPLLANADARELRTGEECRAELVEHLTRGVDWVAAVEKMVAGGVTDFVEVGPGKVLTGLIKRISPDVNVHPIDDPASPGRLALPEFVTSNSPPIATVTGAAS